MAVNPNFPLVVTQFATTDAFDPAATPVWNAFNPQPTEMTSAGGRQYELDITQAGEATYTLFDQAEALNPANTAGPYYPNIKPLRQIIDQAMWPPAPVGAAVNLLNLNALPVAYDPGFESYAVGSTPSWITAVGATSPVVGTTTPHSGSQDITYTVASGATVQGIQWQVPCIPGQQYTASVWVQQSSASTQQLVLPFVATGTSTSATGSWVRLTMPFTASQPFHTIQLVTTGTAVAGTVLVDDVQHEVGSTANTFSSTGPVIYGVLDDFIERYPRSWKDGGLRGQAKLTCVDALAVLANQFLQTEYRGSVLAKKPDYYWPLSEPQGTTRFAEISGNNGPPMARLDGYFGAGPTFTPGSQTNIPGDASGVGLATDQPASGALNLPVSIASTDLLARGTPIAIGGAPGASYSYTVSAWITHPVIPGTSGGRIFLLIGNPTSSGLFQAQWVVNNATSFEFIGQGGIVIFNDNYAGTTPHLYVMTTNVVAGGNTTTTVYVDGVNVGSASAGTVNYPQGTVAQIGGAVNPAASTTSAGLNSGTYSHFAVWNRTLSANEIADLWNAGSGYPGESSGTRIKRYLGFKWIGATAIDTGQSLMGASNLTLNTSVLDACQAVATSENGRFVVDATNQGAPTFQSRTRQYLNTAAKWVLGEQELPYEEDIEYDFDDQQIWNDVQVSRVGGVTAYGGTATAIATSQKAAGQRTYTRQINVQDDGEAQNAANWIFAGHSQAVQRLATLTIKPSSNPALWPMALGARIGDRITVHRRTSAGTPMVADFFIERIEHSRKVSDTNLEWTVSYQASPFAATRQPWILGDATYGVLGSTTLPAY